MIDLPFLKDLASLQPSLLLPCSYLFIYKHSLWSISKINIISNNKPLRDCNMDRYILEFVENVIPFTFAPTSSWVIMA